MTALVLFPSRVAFVNPDGTLTPEAYRALQEIVSRTGGTIGQSGTDTFADVLGVDSGAVNVAYTDIVQSGSDQSIADMLTQPASSNYADEMVMQPEIKKAAIAVNAASTDLPTVIALCNQLRAALIANNIVI